MAPTVYLSHLYIDIFFCLQSKMWSMLKPGAHFEMGSILSIKWGFGTSKTGVKWHVLGAPD